MSLRISEIHIAECGPLARQSWTGLENKNLVLVYGKNESGKSFLIDLLINSLFRNKKAWGYLRREVNGRIILTGSLAGPDGDNSSRLEFSPQGRSKIKLEDYLEKRPDAGLPPEMTRLLVVRAGEVEIERDEHGLTVDFLKRLFSQKKILSEIEREIGETVKNAEILEAEGRINVPARGKDIQNYQDLLKDLKQLETLTQKINESYELGELKTLQDKKKALKEKRNRLEMARRHRAFLLSREIEKIRVELEHFLEEEEIREVRERIEEFKQKNREAALLAAQVRKLEEELAAVESVGKELRLQEKARAYQAQLLTSGKKKKQEELRTTEEKLAQVEELYRRYGEKILLIRQKNKDIENRKSLPEEYHWLRTARENYLKYREVKKPLLPAGMALIASSFLALVTVILLLLHKTGPALPLLILSLLGMFYAVWKSFRSREDRSVEQERRMLVEEFRKRYGRYGRELRSLADLEARENEIEKEFYRFESSRDQLEQLKNESRQILLDLGMLLNESLASQELEERIEKVEKVLAESRDRVACLRQELEEISGALSKLDVAEKDYEYENPGVEFSRQRLEELKRKMDRLAQREAEKLDYATRLERINLELSDLEKEIARWFEQKFERKTEPEFWEETLQEIERERKKLEAILSSKSGELKGLGISERDYLPEDPGETYQPEKVRQLERELEDVARKISEADGWLQGLRKEIAILTGCDSSASWNILLEALFQKIEETRKQLGESEATLISRILLTWVIRELDREETEKVEEILQSPEVAEMLHRLTGRYREIYPKLMENEKMRALWVSDGANEFSLADLSTGAREQVLLALRIAFIKKLLRGRSCFLVLDDAFQHTDYERRPLLVDNMVELASSGWQIFYLTMDDHIRDLFRSRAAGLNDRYQFIELGS